MNGEAEIIDAQVVDTVPPPKETALAPVEKHKEMQELRPLSGQQMAESIRHYKEIQKVLDESMPDGIDIIGSKKYRNKTYWRAVARAFRLNVEVVGEKRVENKNDYSWHLVCKASFPAGDTAVGTGSCSASEKNSRQRTEHNVRAHAETRAYNRAVSNLVGFGEVTSEEIDRKPGQSADTRQQRQRQAQQKADTQAKPSGNGKPKSWLTPLWDKAKAAGMPIEKWKEALKNFDIDSKEKAEKAPPEDAHDFAVGINNWIRESEMYQAGVEAEQAPGEV